MNGRRLEIHTVQRGKNGRKARVITKEYDRGPPGPLRQQIMATADEVHGKDRLPLDTGQWTTVIEPLPVSARLVVIRCDLDGQGHCGRALAQVWNTSRGLFYEARLEYSHTRGRQRPPNPTLLVHPELPGRVVDVPGTAVKHHKKNGWREAPSGTKPPRRYRPQYGVVVRDLIDYYPRDPNHPCLRVRCPDHGEIRLDRHRLLQLLDGIRQGRLERDSLLARWLKQDRDRDRTDS